MAPWKLSRRHADRAPVQCDHRAPGDGAGFLGRGGSRATGIHRINDLCILIDAYNLGQMKRAPRSPTLKTEPSIPGNPTRAASYAVESRRIQAELKRQKKAKEKVPGYKHLVTCLLMSPNGSFVYLARYGHVILSLHGSLGPNDSVFSWLARSS